MNLLNAYTNNVIDPIFYQIIYAYLCLIADENGNIVITERRLSERYGVSVKTIRHIMYELYNRGLIKFKYIDPTGDHIKNNSIKKRSAELGYAYDVTILDWGSAKDFMSLYYDSDVWDIPDDILK